MSQQDICRSSGRDKVWRVVVVILVLLLAGLAALRIRIGSRLGNRLDEFRAQGYPMSEADLNRHYAIPLDAENAADVYLQAFDFYVEANGVERQGLPRVGTAELPDRTDPMPITMKALAETFLVKNESTLACLHRAATIKHCQYPIKFSQDPQQLIPDLTTVRQAAFLLSLEAYWHLDNGDPSQATRSVETALALANSFPASTVMNRLVQVSMRALAMQTLERILNQISLTEHDLLSLSETIHAFETDKGLRQTFIGERCFGLYCLDHQILGRMTSLAKAVGVLQPQAMKYIDMMQEFIDITNQPEHKQKQLCMAIESTIAKRGMFAQTLAPAFTRTFELENRCLANCRVARTALALERYYLAQGQPAESIDVLVPEYLDDVPKDPFDGQALRFRRLDQGFVVYSIGEDLSDDGGKELDKEERRKNRDLPWDVTFVVKRPR
jgi:hypothetical protein